MISMVQPRSGARPNPLDDLWGLVQVQDLGSRLADPAFRGHHLVVDHILVTRRPGYILHRPIPDQPICGLDLDLVALCIEHRLARLIPQDYLTQPAIHACAAGPGLAVWHED